MADDKIVIAAGTELLEAEDVPGLLAKIRPSWQANGLIKRVRRLLPVDPGSACQRIFNAATHDLREKIVIAGVDVAKEAAKQHKLPPVERAEDVEDYPTAKLLDLAYRIGLLTRPEWRRLSRCYEIRRDLEHEDDEYEAGIEDCIYIFKTAIETVLSRDPITLLRVVDVKQVVEQPTAIVPDKMLLEDYGRAPQPRQEELLRFLLSTALDASKPEIVRSNSFLLLRAIEPLTQNPAKLSIASHFQERIGRGSLDLLHARVAFAAGILPYLKASQRSSFFAALLAEMQKATPSWRAYTQHGEVLRTLYEVGGLKFVPPEVRAQMVEWMVLTYIGEPGGYGTWGRNRSVFYSNTAAPLIEEFFKDAASLLADTFPSLEEVPVVRMRLQDKNLARRFEQLVELIASHAKGGDALG